MSGGYFDYSDRNLKCEIFGFGDKMTDAFEDLEISELIWDIFDLMHDYDYYKSGDIDENDWLKSKADFKNKWFESDRKDRIKSIIDKDLENTKQELYKTFDIEKEK